MDYCRVIVEGAPFVQEEGFTYRVPPHLAAYVAVGSLVYVPFGKGDRLRQGFVIAEEAEAGAEAARVKAVTMVQQLTPVITPELMALCRFVAERYACALIYAIKLVVPKYLLHHPFVAFEEVEGGRQHPLNNSTLAEDAAACAQGVLRLVPHSPLAGRATRYYRLMETEAVDAALAALKRAPKQRAILQHIAQVGSASAEALQEAFGNCRPALQALCEKGYIMEETTPPRRREGTVDFVEPTLTAAQAEVVEAVQAQLAAGCYHKNLINGVTGSGKTLIYERLAEAVARAGRQALILVPEIALSQQLYLRLQRRFGDRIALLHSQLTERARFAIWQQAAAHEIDVVLGPRSALFLPFADLGLIVVDEEHESSYKQSEPDPRYHAIAVAEYLAQRQQAVLLLGSATPSVDTLYEVVQKKCHIFNLPERVGQAALPTVTLVDMAEARRRGERGLLSEQLRSAMAEALARGEQIILLINKKGYSSSVGCRECGEVIRCPRCDIPLTYYQSSGELKCNYCEFHMPMVSRCPSCGSDFLELHGSGTESIEQVCAEHFPKARIDRLDAQALADRASREGILEKYARRETDILVGTQLLAKGLDFINTTCIGVVSADLTLNLPDFRSAERCFQLMVQVAGRAGRDQKPSTVYIQTWQPEHYAFQDAMAQNVHQFFLDEIAFRKKWLYPPIVHLCRIIVSDFAERDVEKSMASIYNYIIQQPVRKAVIGPSYAPLSKKNNRYRMHLIIKTGAAADGRALMTRLRQELQALRLSKTTRVLIDIDPENIF